MKYHKRAKAGTLEQRIYDFIRLCGGSVRHIEIAPAMQLPRTAVTPATKRLEARGCITKFGRSHGVRCKITGPRPKDRRGDNPGSRKVWYGVNGKVNKKGRSGYTRRGPSKPLPVPNGELWHVWGFSPKLPDANETCDDSGGTVRPQETEPA